MRQVKARILARAPQSNKPSAFSNVIQRERAAKIAPSKPSLRTVSTQPQLRNLQQQHHSKQAKSISQRGTRPTSHSIRFGAPSHANLFTPGNLFEGRETSASFLEESFSQDEHTLQDLEPEQPTGGLFQGRRECEDDFFEEDDEAGEKQQDKEDELSPLFQFTAAGQDTETAIEQLEEQRSSMVLPNVLDYNSVLILGATEPAKAPEARKLLKKMPEDNIRPNETTLDMKARLERLFPTSRDPSSQFGGLVGLAPLSAADHVQSFRTNSSFTEPDRETIPESLEELRGKTSEDPNDQSFINQSLFDDQIAYETKTITEASLAHMKLVSEAVAVGRGSELGGGTRMLQRWIGPLCEEITHDLQKHRDQYAPTPRNLKDKDDPMSPKKISVLIIHEVLSHALAKPGGVPIKKVVATLSYHLRAQVNFYRTKTEQPQIFANMQKKRSMEFSRMINRIAAKHGLGTDWGSREATELANRLLLIFIRTAKIDKLPEVTQDSEFAISYNPNSEEAPETVPAFQFIIRNGESKRQKGKIAMIQAREEIFREMERGHLLRETMDARHLPMVVPPNPWTSPMSGGYLGNQVSLMRSRSRVQTKLLLKSSHKLHELYDGLNVLSSTPWKVNEDVFRVVDEAWNVHGGGIGELPSRTNLPEPLIPSDVTDVTAMNEWKKQFKRVRHINADLHSLRCDTILKMQVAKEFMQSKMIYFPHNIDFRGRCYPIPPNLNHMGSDLCRGLLTFAHGKPLGPKGLDWLKIQVSNLCGNDKVPFEERLKFADTNMEQIFDSADQPLAGSRWWLKADDPWQCLATCVEITKAIRSGDPENYICHLPIHQDGSCNGLQHYAALGGDRLGALKVNVLPGDRPQDVYSGVAELVARRVAIDAANGDPLAILLNGKVTRKIVKQTVMTSVYGVTFIGARAQIRNAMKDQKTVTEDDSFKASIYVARCTFDSLKEMFLGARTIMDWLAQCARIIAKEKKEGVTWTTPMGLPVIQPYEKPRSDMSVSTVIQNVSLYPNKESIPVNSVRQKSAFPPNYVHSLDSTHMFYTALACHDAGLTFGSVHDSFWTHPADVDQMNVILREQFIRLHEQPLLHRLLHDWKEKYPDLDFPPVPERGDLNLTEVLNSKYFFH